MTRIKAESTYTYLAHLSDPVGRQVILTLRQLAQPPRQVPDKLNFLRSIKPFGRMLRWLQLKTQLVGFQQLAAEDKTVVFFSVGRDGKLPSELEPVFHQRRFMLTSEEKIRKLDQRLNGRFIPDWAQAAALHRPLYPQSYPNISDSKQQNLLLWGIAHEVLRLEDEAWNERHPGQRPPWRPNFKQLRPSRRYEFKSELL